MMESSTKARFSINTKSTGRICHQIHVGNYSFDKRSVKPNGLAFYKCNKRSCAAVLRAKYRSKESSNGYEKPLLVSIPGVESHLMPDGKPHVPNPAERLVRETRQSIQESIKNDPSKSVRQIFEECFTRATDSILATEDKQLLADFKKAMPSKVQMERSMYRWRKSKANGALKKAKEEDGDEQVVTMDVFNGDFAFDIKEEVFNIKEEADSGGEDRWEAWDLDKEEEGSGIYCYQLNINGQNLFIWDNGDAEIKNVEIQMESERKSNFTKFVTEQAQRYESKVSNIFESLLKLLLAVLIQQATKLEGKSDLRKVKEDDVDYMMECETDMTHLEDLKDMSEDLLDPGDEVGGGDDLVDESADLEPGEELHQAQQAAAVAAGEDQADHSQQQPPDQKPVKIEKLDTVSTEQPSPVRKISEVRAAPTALVGVEDCYLDLAPEQPKEEKPQPEKKLKCEDCGKMYAFRSKLNRHIKSTHMKIKDYGCNICKKEFACLSHVKAHMRVHHQTEDVEKADYSHLKKERDERSTRFCSECQIWFDNSGLLTSHVVEHHPKRPDLLPFKIRRSGPLPWTRGEVWERVDWTCPICTEDPIYKADGLSGLVSHVRVIHSDSLLCWVCGQVFSNKEGKMVYEHMREAHPLKAVQACNICGVYNQTKKLYASHMKVHRMENLDGSEMYQCSKCAYSTHRPDNFASHRSMHKKMEETAGMTFVCDECGNVFKTKLSLKNHIRSQHKTDNQTFECKECHKSFLQRHNLLQHMLIHGDEKAYSCEFCPQSFATPSTLIKHRQRNHWSQMGILPKHTCDQCDKRFWQPGELKEHVDRVHLGLKNFVCLECGNRFGSRKVLNKHLRRIHKISGGLKAPPTNTAILPIHEEN